MPPKKNSTKKTPKFSPEDEQTAFRIATRMAGAYRRHGFEMLAEDFANKALMALQTALERSEIRNHEAFMTWKIRNLIFDALRRKKVEDKKITVAGYELELVKGKNLNAGFDNYHGRVHPIGLTIDFINKEDEKMMELIVLASWLILPDETDQQIVAKRVSGQYETITELAQEFGKSPNVMANHLVKLLGTDGTPGAVTPVGFMMKKMSLKTAEQFVRQIERLNAASVVSQPILGAITHLELMSTNSRAHQQQAAMGIARLNWIQNNLPSQRGLPNKVLHRLIRAACFYVMEPNDARHDTRSDVGLHDDVQVLKALQEAIRKFAK